MNKNAVCNRRMYNWGGVKNRGVMHGFDHRSVMHHWYSMHGMNNRRGMNHGGGVDKWLWVGYHITMAGDCMSHNASWSGSGDSQDGGQYNLIKIFINKIIIFINFFLL